MKLTNLPLRTANAAMVAGILAGARVPEYSSAQDPHHGLLTTANASLFSQAHFSEPMTTYATGWSDPGGYRAQSEFLAPSLMPSGEKFEHIIYPNAEAFLSDAADDDLRSINGDFLTVDYTETKTTRTIPNRGLRVIVDRDRIKNTPNWQQLYTARLLERIERNAFRRKLALAIASATNAALVWDAAGAADPDYDLANQAILSGDSSGITPNRALWGTGAKLLRYATYGGTNTAKAMAGRLLTPEQASEKVGLQARVDESRYQSGSSKSRIVGAIVLLFTAMGQSGEDPSNFKTARGITEQGGTYAVYVRQLSVKLWELVVEVYETEFCATTLGVRTLSVTAS